MRALVIYESMYGNTHQIADAIAQGLDLSDKVLVLPVARVRTSTLEQVDLVVVGGPTHVHGMSRTSTRKAALDSACEPGAALHGDLDGTEMGLREWFDSLGTLHAKAAAFDTRADAPIAFTGHAAKGIAKMLRRHGLELIAAPESFLVNKENRLLPGEEDRARAWGQRLVHACKHTEMHMTDLGHQSGGAR
jgi:hypothetical protein